MKFGVISNNNKDPHGKNLEAVCSTIKENNGVVALKILAEEDFIINERDLKDLDMIFSLGGDGTFLNVARKTSTTGIPILGVNIGNLGFLTGTEVHDINKTIHKIVNGQYSIEKRIMLEANVTRNDKELKKISALNDIVISRKVLSGILNLKIHIDNCFMETFPGDGLIISTPSGSTGYSLSAGGPIVDHRMDLMLITPKCSHIMQAKAFITPSDSIISAFVLEDEEYTCLLTADGQMGFELKGNDKVYITKSDLYINKVCTDNETFFCTLRRKIFFRNGDYNETK